MVNKFPRQKIGSTSKNKQWYKNCTMYGVDMALDEDSIIKPRHTDIMENFKLYNGERDPKELKKNFDTLDKLNLSYSPSFKNFSTISDRIDELTGEYAEKGSDYVIAALDRDAINTKMDENKERIKKAIVQIYNDDSIQNEEGIREKLEDLIDFKFMSKTEVAANKVLNYYKKLNKVKNKEIEGFKEALITAIAVFKVTIVNNSIRVEKCSPDSIYAVRSGLSNDIKDSEIIAKVDYLPESKIIDTYGDTMTNVEINRIIDGKLYEYSVENDSKKELVFKSMEDLNRFTRSSINTKGSRDVKDELGNIRVITLNWKGYRKIFKRKYYDDNGEVQHDYKGETYKAKKELGETLKERWITEEHESILIGGDIVTAYGIKEYQHNDVYEPNRNISGYVGGYFNVGNEKAKSMIDKVKSYLYLSDMIFARLEDLMAKNIGKVIELDLATFPDGWDVTKVMYYLKAHGILVKNSFSVGKKGVALNKLAGQYSQGSRTLDSELGVSINYMLQFLSLVDDRIAKNTGVTNQRLGAIHSRELVGNVERSRIQSSLITEIWFNRYEQIVMELYDTILEMSKMVIKEDDKLQFVLDDMSYQILSKELAGFKNAKFGLFPVNNLKYIKLRSTLEGLAANSIANGSMDVTQLISLYDSSSMSEMVDKQYKIDKDRKRAEQQQFKQESENRQKDIKAAKEYELQGRQLDHKFDMELEDLKGQYRVKIEEMKIRDNALSDHLKNTIDLNKNGIDDRLEIEKIMQEIDLKKRELDLMEKKINVEEKKVEVSKNK